MIFLKALFSFRRGLGLCSMGGPIYAVGGLDDEMFYSTVERYDVNSDLWSIVSPMNSARGGVAVVKLKVIIFIIFIFTIKASFEFVSQNILKEMLIFID